MNTRTRLCARGAETESAFAVLEQPMGNIDQGCNEEREVITIGARNYGILTCASTTETETRAKVAARCLVMATRARACLDVVDS